jgi:hypothetical protein
MIDYEDEYGYEEEEMYRILEVLLERGTAVALPDGGEIRWKHVEHCSDAEIRAALSLDEVRAAHDAALGRPSRN